MAETHIFVVALLLSAAAPGLVRASTLDQKMARAVEVQRSPESSYAKLLQKRPEPLDPKDVATDYHDSTAQCLGSWRTNPLRSRIATQEELQEPEAATLLSIFKEKETMHRKQWEYVYLLKTLKATNLVAGVGKKAIGFAVGREPTVAYLASKNVSVVATDLPPQDSRAQAWEGGQHMHPGLNTLNDRLISDPDHMKLFVTQQWVDMNIVEQSDVWKGIGMFDLVWSICSIEHVGSIRKAMEFVEKSLKLLKPGGTAVHTTEFNLVSTTDTIDHTGTVFFRKKDIDTIRKCALHLGYEMAEPCYDIGTGPIDYQKDLPPYAHTNHMRLTLPINGKDWVSTCVGMTIMKPMNFVETGLNCADIFSADQVTE